MLGDLLLPRQCAGCRAPGEVLCPRCREELSQPPFLVSPRIDPGVPVWALGPYSPVRRGVIVQMKEYANFAVRRHVGAVIAAALRTLCARGELVTDPVLVPAPTRRRSARLRGGDPVDAVGRASGFPTVAALTYAPGVRDSVGLGANDRRANIAGAVRLVRALPPGRQVVLIDDVVTTGATLATAAGVLAVTGVPLVGALTFAAA